MVTTRSFFGFAAPLARAMLPARMSAVSHRLLQTGQFADQEPRTAGSPPGRRWGAAQPVKGGTARGTRLGTVDELEQSNGFMLSVGADSLSVLYRLWRQPGNSPGRVRPSQSTFGHSTRL